MDLEIKHAAFEIKELKADGSFEGYGAYFGNVDLGKDIIDSAAFTGTIKAHQANGTMPAMFFSHDIREPIGDWTAMETDKRGLKMSGQLWIGDGIPKAMQAYRLLKSKTEKGLSIGYLVNKGGSTYDEKSGIRTLRDLDLREVSPTPFPMNPKAKITAVKSLMMDRDILTIREAEEILRDVGFSGNDAKAFLARLQSGLKQRDAASDQLRALLESTKNVLKG